MSAEAVTYIYALCDPRTWEPRYIGQTKNPKLRLRAHLKDRERCHKTHWIQFLKRHGMKPELVIVEIVLANRAWQEVEKSWISRLRSRGFRLVNTSAGGDGCSLPPRETPKYTIAGERFGKLLVTGFARYIRNRACWFVQCDCGISKVACGTDMRGGRIRSCGRCVSRGVRHGGRYSSTYSSWCAMIARCKNPLNEKYELYGGADIRISERWRKFQNFRADMGERPDGKILGRINTLGHFEPGNCEWTTTKELCSHTKVSVRLTIGGDTRGVLEWSRISGVNDSTIRKRVKAGWPESLLLLKASPLNRRHVKCN